MPAAVTLTGFVDPPWRSRAGTALFRSHGSRSAGTRDSLALTAGLALLGSFLLAQSFRFEGRFWWVAWLSVLPLFLAIHTLRPARAMAIGFIWGLGFSIFSGLGLETPVLSRALSALLYPACITALYTLSGAFLTSRLGFRPVLLATGWVGVEIALQPIGLPHGLLAAGEWDWPIVPFLAGFFGHALVSAVVAFASVTILLVVSIAVEGGSEAGAAYLGDQSRRIPVYLNHVTPRGAGLGCRWLARSPPPLTT